MLNCQSRFVTILPVSKLPRRQLGLDWVSNLNVGGVITQSVVNKPDNAHNYGFALNAAVQYYNTSFIS